jgi:hypothetical protein
MTRKSLFIANAMLIAALAAMGSHAAEDVAFLDEKDTTSINATTKSYWAYRKVARPAAPPVKNKAWVASPIDAFILAKVEAAGLTMAAPASKQALIRRAYYDLTGLPPTLKEVEVFVASKDPEAYVKILDTLLARPQYGEKWGRFWLDLVGYAETNGYERDGNKPEIHRYRDYVIGALNKDKPYNQFLMEQLAGDEMVPATADSITATGYMRLGVWDDEPADRALAKYNELDGIVSTTASVMLGASVGCARCHDHKKDPILQKDYYSLLAFFRNIRGYTKRGNVVQLPATNPNRAKELQEQVQKIEALYVSKNPAAKAAATPGTQHLVKDARQGGEEWLYYIGRRAQKNWNKATFKPKGWRKGQSGFGKGNPPGSKTKTKWDQPLILLHKTFNLTSVPAGLRLHVHHDENVEVVINGKRVFAENGYLSAYKTVSLPNPKSYLKVGANTIAVQCKQTSGGQYVDVGLEIGGATIGDLLIADGRKTLGETTYNQYIAAKTEMKTMRTTKAVNALAISEHGTNAPATHILKRGLPAVPLGEVQPGYLTVLGEAAPTIPAPKPGAKTTGRRMVLAQWIGSKQNKMTARVMANRIWQMHFGRGIVPTPNDFGNLGMSPTHPALLTWLAAEFMAQDWSMKKMHKIIMTSNAYKMSSASSAAGQAKDPANNLFWRFNMRRFTAEEIRDSILATTGQLNLKMGGPSIFPPLPREVLATSSKPGSVWGRSSPEDAVRRSVYIKVKRSLRFTLLVAHDQADTDNSCAVRFTTTVPTQALTMINSKFLNDSAVKLAERAKAEGGATAAAQVGFILSLATQRKATPKEVTDGVTFLGNMKQNGLTDDQALQQFCLVALNLNEFIYLD